MVNTDLTMNEAYVPTRRLTKDWGNAIEALPDSKRITHLHTHQNHIGFIQVEKERTKFCTGSSYEGKYDALGFAGFGTYIFPHGAKYVGYFADGQFHGEGTITYPKGAQVDGTWIKGKLMSFCYTFADGLEFSEPWTYCQFPDRAFYIEHLEGLRPANIERWNNKRTHLIPEGTFDTGDGYFVPQAKVVRDCKTDKVMRIVTPKEEKFIRSHFRENKDRPIGVNFDLYEYFTMGKNEEVAQIEAENRQATVQDEESTTTIHSNMSEIHREGYIRR